MILWYSDHSPWCFLIWTVTLEALGENYMFLCKLVSIDWVVLTAQCETVIVQLNIWKLQHTVENKTFPWTVITPLNNTHTQAQIKERMGFGFVSSVTPVTCLNTFEACSLCVPWRLATISQLISIPLPQHPPKKKKPKSENQKTSLFLSRPPLLTGTGLQHWHGSKPKAWKEKHPLSHALNPHFLFSQMPKQQRRWGE